MKTDGEILFSRFRDVSLRSPARSERYKRFVRERGPYGAEFHHVFGSAGPLKSTDYMGVAVLHKEHMEGELNKDWIIAQAPEALANLLLYVEMLEEENEHLRKLTGRKAEV